MFENKLVNIVKLDNNVSDEINIRFSEILCVDYDKRTSECNISTALLNMNVDLYLKLRDAVVKSYNGNSHTATRI